MLCGCVLGFIDKDLDAPSEEKIERWLAVGDIQNLEQIVLDGE